MPVVRRWLVRALGLLVPLAVAVSVAPAADEPQAEEADWTKTTTRWFESIDPGAVVRVRNPFGDVYARFGGYENRVEVQATIQRLEADRPELEVRRTPGEGGDLEVVVARADSGEQPLPRPSDRRDRVDLVVFIPQGAILDVETVADKIEAKGLRGELIARSVKGDILVRKISGRVRASSERGKITAALQTGATTQTQEFKTETGDIEIYLWADADVSVDLATSGQISTDFSMHIEHRRSEEPGKYGTAVVGQGGPGLVLRSKRGHLSLSRLPTQEARE